MLHKFSDLIDSDYSLIRLQRQRRRVEAEPFLSASTERRRHDAPRCNLLVSDSEPVRFGANTWKQCWTGNDYTFYVGIGSRLWHLLHDCESKGLFCEENEAISEKNWCYSLISLLPIYLRLVWSLWGWKVRGKVKVEQREQRWTDELCLCFLMLLQKNDLFLRTLLLSSSCFFIFNALYKHLNPCGVILLCSFAKLQRHPSAQSINI